jgi:4-aminobutyrate aminotransferase-like enzyme
MNAGHDDAFLQQAAKDHLWMHFTRHGSYAEADVPVIVRGEGAYIWDSHGKRYLDGLAGLFVSQLGHGRTEPATSTGCSSPAAAARPSSRRGSSPRTTSSSPASR